MPKHKPGVLDDNTLRAFYEFCGLAPRIIEAAIHKRYEEPTNFIGRAKAVAAANAARARQSSGQRPTRAANKKD